MTHFQFILVQGSFFFAFYVCIHRLFFNRSTAFLWHRWILLLLPVAAFAAPFFLNNIGTTVYGIKSFNFAPILVSGINTVTNAKAKGVGVSESLTISQFCYVAWLLGSALFFLRFLINIVKTVQSIPKKKELTTKYYSLYIDASDNNAWTFFRHIIIPASLSSQEKEMVLLHESTHAKQLHSLDILFAQSIKVVFWWNPLVYVWINDMRDNHEFIADAEVSKSFTLKKYSTLLLNNALGTKEIHFANTFLDKYNLKTRITMMKKESKIGKIATVSGAICLVVSYIGIAGQQNEKNVYVSNNVAKIIEPADFSHPKDSIYTQAEQMPKFPGGEDSMMHFIQKNFTYPKTSEKMSGTIYTSFVVDKKGGITNVKVEKGIGDLWDNEAVRVIKLMPDWSPARNKGKNVKLCFVLPIRIEY